VLNLQWELVRPSGANAPKGERSFSRVCHTHLLAKISLLTIFGASAIWLKCRERNPWFKRGTIFREALGVLRTAEGPLTSREIAEAMLAAHGVTDASRKAVSDLAGSVQSSMTNNDGRAVVRHGEGMPSRWALTRP
jgi:hypothetical protein